MLTFSKKLKAQIVLEMWCRYRLGLRLSENALKTENSSFSRTRFILVMFFSVMIYSQINHECVKHLSDAGKINAFEFCCA